MPRLRRRRYNSCGSATLLRLGVLVVKSCIVVSHTHWDREWYEPFQRFRLRLVYLMDKLLHILEHEPSFRYFMLDGQTIVLEDYLEIRPECEPALRRHVRAGRVLIGPWYILPDEFLVSGEALIRNLLLGMRQAECFGAVMAVGYIPDPFGHISQMPQILRGFGIASAALRRGLDDQATELLWQAPDGSTVLLCYLRDGYDNAARLPGGDEAAFAQEIQRLYRSLSPFLTTPFALLMHGTDHMEPTPELPRLLDAARSRTDMELVHGTLPLYIDEVSKSLHLEMSDPCAMAPGRLAVVKGELRSPKRHHLLPGVLSTRMWIKQRNDHIQDVLERWAEPLSAFSSLAQSGRKPLAAAASSALLHQAWKYLLQNQPHDSICGCSADQTHREMITRFDWAEQIGEEVSRRSMEALAGQVDTRLPDELTGPCIPLFVFNPLPATRTDLVTASVQVPGSLERFAIIDVHGRPAPHQVLERKEAEYAALQLDREQVAGLAAMVEMVAGLGLSVQEIKIAVDQGQAAPPSASIDVTLVTGGRTDPALISAAQRQVEAVLADGAVQTFRVRAHQATTVEFCFVAEGVPACGYKTYYLAGADRESSLATPAMVSFRQPPAETRAASLHMENEFLAVDASLEDGRLSLFDKRTGIALGSLHRFIDGGDRGDEYNYCPPDSDAFVTCPSEPPVVEWLEAGPARLTVQVSQIYRLPTCLTDDRAARSADTVECSIASQISLSPGVARVDIRTVVDNRARDHRLRVHFATPFQTDHSSAEGTFDVLERPLGVPTDTKGWAEQPVPTHPQRTFVDVSDGRHGLLVANRGLPEFEIFRESDGSSTVAITLLRSVGWLSRDDFPCRQGHAGPALATPEAQCQGTSAFDYALIPHSGDWRHAYALAHDFHTPMRVVGTDTHAGSLPPALSLIRLEGKDLVLSSVKAPDAGDGLIVRFYNVAPEPRAAELSAFKAIRRAVLVDLGERELEELCPEDSGKVRIEAKGGRIVTVRLEF